MSSNLTLWSIYVFIFIKCIIDWVFRTGTGFAYPLVPLWIEFWTFQKVVCWCALGMMGNHLAAAKSLQLCPTLCDPIDGSPPGSPVPGVLQARILKWVAISFFNAWKWKVKVNSFSRVQLLVTPWTAAYQAPPSMGFSRQEYWSGVPSPSLMLYIFVFSKEWEIHELEHNLDMETYSELSVGLIINIF